MSPSCNPASSAALPSVTDWRSAPMRSVSESASNRTNTPSCARLVDHVSTPPKKLVEPRTSRSCRSTSRNCCRSSLRRLSSSRRCSRSCAAIGATPSPIAIAAMVSKNLVFFIALNSCCHRQPVKIQSVSRVGRERSPRDPSGRRAPATAQSLSLSTAAALWLAQTAGPTAPVDPPTPPRHPPSAR